MAKRKTASFLPVTFRTDANKKFLAATMDQLMSEPNLVDINGYIGRKFAPTAKSSDSYITENSTDRQNYQLEPGVVINDSSEKIQFFSTYADLLNKIAYYGGDISDHSRLFENEYYSYDPMISLDKFVNFTKYHWLPDGPDAVAVNTSGVNLVETYTVSRNLSNNGYQYTTEAGRQTESLILARGGTYTFVVDQPGIPFWIQSELGIDGISNASVNISVRDVLGVENNGAEVGEIVFSVPAASAQDNFVEMTTVAEVDFALPFGYANIHNNLVSEFISNYPDYAGLTTGLSGKKVVFVEQEQLSNAGDQAWTAPAVIDSNNNVAADEGTLILFADRYNVWQIVIVNNVIKLMPVIDIAESEKVFIRVGNPYASTLFYKDLVGFLQPVPHITSALNTLFVQDGILPSVQTEFSVVEFSNWIIDVDADIVSKTGYTSANGVGLTNGMKVIFGEDVEPAHYQNSTYYVEGVGTSINLVNTDKLVTPELYNDEQQLNYPNTVFPEYITINKANANSNSWSRNNRWTHIDVINKTAEYNNTVPVVDQLTRATRPIIEFDYNIQLINEGRTSKLPVDLIELNDSTAFNYIEGKVIEVAFGVQLVNGMRVVFAADTDPLVRNAIFVITLVQYQLDNQGQPTGDFRVKLTKADDGDIARFDSVVVTQGYHKGEQYWFNEGKWNLGQQKTKANQPPLFDVVDTDKRTLAELPESTFKGTKIFGYKTTTTAAVDPVLGFPISYRNFETQGDIEFSNFYDADTFTHSGNDDASLVSKGFMLQANDDGTTLRRNVWSPVVEPSKQFQLLSFEYSTTSEFIIDINPLLSTAVLYLHVYVNNTSIQPGNYTTSDTTLTIVTPLTVGDKIDVLIYSNEVSENGFYQVPLNLALNAQNINVDSVTLGQMRNHLGELKENTTKSLSSLRDIEIHNAGGNILQHSSPVPYSSLFLLDETANLPDALSFAQREYTRYKSKFLELATTLSGLDTANPTESVNLILQSMNAIKTSDYPWYSSDMIPYGPDVVSTSYTVFNPLTISYEISAVYNDTKLSNRSVLVYRNNVQLTKGIDYTFDTDRPGVSFTNNVTLEIDDVIRYDEYNNTDANFIPETPTKLGLYPKFIPMIYVDTSYREPISVIRGHDGSITPAFGDFRDQFLLEVEKRIYNNIKITSTDTANELFYIVQPGKFRKTDYSNEAINNILSNKFLEWVGDNKVGFTSNDTFNSSDPFTWNYSRFSDRINGDTLPGSWKACYRYFYDTIRPNETPWEMLGFVNEPTWWQSHYGPAPYTSGNKILWKDLEAGHIVDGDRVGIDERFARPGLLSAIPVDANGFVVSPAAVLTASFNAKYAATAWAIGHQGPAEAAWRASSEFPYAFQQALALAKPARYFGSMIDLSRFSRDSELSQVVNSSGHHISQTDIVVHGLSPVTNTVVRSSGYLNWISDYLISLGIVPFTKITEMVQNYSVNLAYKVGGFTDNKFIQVLAEQNSPASTNSSVIIPNENYKVHLAKSAPISRLVYSSVLIEKTTNGYSVRGYDLTKPYFNIIPSVVNSNAQKITVLDKEATVFNDFQPISITVPYGHEFGTDQQVVDFLISYERFLQAQGFVFDDYDETLSQRRDWKLSVKEFLYWTQQGWKPGSIIVLSPVVNAVTVNTSGSITDAISNRQYSSRILDQNFKLLRSNKFNVIRSAEATRVQLIEDESVIGYAEFDLVQHEHVLVFDNTTVFDDVIYKPELGSRQHRLKLIGQKTGDWDGSLHAPGFIYNSGEVAPWLAGTDYLKGDLVEFKDRIYVSLAKIVATVEFDFANWKQLESGEIKTGLLPNFASIAVRPQSYYDSYGRFNSADEVKFSHGLIGFKPRQYLDDLGINETTQIEMYKGFIKQKGSANAINELAAAEFNDLQSSLTFSEEWAVRVGEYGALNINPYLEVELDEQAFSVNPAIAKFVGDSTGDGITIFGKEDLYKATDHYNGIISTTRTTSSDYANDMLTAGYVHLSDVDTTIYDLANYAELNDQLSEIGSGYTIWCAKDFAQEWNVYRVSETEIDVIAIDNTLNQHITLSTNAPHGFSVDDIFLVRNFSNEFDGFYKVSDVPTLTELVVATNLDISELSRVSGRGTLFSLDSLRFTYMDDVRGYTPDHGWQENEKIWIDVAAQGQEDKAAGTWKVYTKTKPWSPGQTVEQAVADYVENSNYGASIKIDPTETLIVTGAPDSGAGLARTFVKASATYAQADSLVPDAIGTLGFGYSTAISTNYVAVGAPGSDANDGYVYVYGRTEGESFTRDQILVGGLASGDQAGTSLALSKEGKWLYVGSPGTEKVYAYGLVSDIDLRTQVTNIAAPGTINSIELAYDIMQVVVDNGGADYSDGATVVISDTTLAGGDTAIGITSVNFLTGHPTLLDGEVTTVILSASGDYIATPTVSIVKPGNVVINSTTVTLDGSNVFVPTSTGLYSGMFVNGTGFDVSTQISKVHNSNLIELTQANTAPISSNIEFFDAGINFAGSVIEGPTPGTTEEIVITSDSRTYLPGVDYTINGTAVDFTNLLPAGDVTIEQKPYFLLVETITGPAGSGFGTSLDCNEDGSRLLVGAPDEEITGFPSAGSAYVYARGVESFVANGQGNFTTAETIGKTTVVSVNGVYTNEYYIAGPNVVTFTLPPAPGSIVDIETNAFSSLEQIIGSDPQEGAKLGQSLAMCATDCAVYLGSPGYTKDGIFNTGAVVKYHNQGRLYGSNTGTISNPAFTVGHEIHINNFTVVATGTDLDSLVSDINAANILGIHATSVDNDFLQVTSTRTVDNNLMQISSGAGTILEDAGIEVYAEMQVITNPYDTPNEQFGSKVALATDARKLIVASDKGTTRLFTTYDNKTTTIDQMTTLFYSMVRNSGAVYLYELYDDPRNNVGHPGRHTFVQQLNPGGDDTVDTGDQFGYAVDIINEEIVVTAPSDAKQLVDDNDTTLDVTGSVYLFVNSDNKRGWDTLRYAEPVVDVGAISRMYVYNKASNIIETTLEMIDPIKGKILGLAEQEISYKTDLDPAVYNAGPGHSSYAHWGSAQVNQVWWNTSIARFIEYEQGSTEYRSANWGKLFPGSEIEILEWTESDVLPSQYASNNSGVPKHEDDSAYVEIVTVSTINNEIISKYYFWVKNNTELSSNAGSRKITSNLIKSLIENPKAQGLPYAAVISPSAILTCNIADYMLSADAVLHIDYELLPNNSIIHSEYELMQQGGTNSFNIPNKIFEKIIDSLAGEDLAGKAVPDPLLSIADQVGISVRPRQSIFVNQKEALSAVVRSANAILIKSPIAKTADLLGMSGEEEAPSLVNSVVATEEELGFLESTTLPLGHTVLVEHNTTNNNLWSVVELSSLREWVVIRTQAFKHSVYWELVDWYATGFGDNAQVSFAAETLVDALQLPYSPGDLIRISNSIQGGWELVEVAANNSFVTVGLNNGTLQLLDTLVTDDNAGYSVRGIVRALFDDIFTGTLRQEKHNVFFTIINYLYTEQKSIDWIFKTSFINVQHTIRHLVETPNYIRDNQTYYQDYINEVKPYSATIREYLLQYTASEQYSSASTDFDLPPYFDTTTNLFRSPSGELAKDAQIVATGFDGNTLISDRYPEWYNHRKLAVSHIDIVIPGAGYVTAPTITIIGGGEGVTPAIAYAIIDGDSGTVVDIVLTSLGSGYTSTPTVIVNGSAVTHATARAQLKNNQVRSIASTLVFDRIAYRSGVTPWAKNTQYEEDDVIVHNNKGYVANTSISASDTFVLSQYTAWLPPLGTGAGAADRIMTYYDPSDLMPQVEKIEYQLVSTTEVVASKRIYVHTVSGIFPGMRITEGNAVLATITNVVFDTANDLKYIEVDRDQTLALNTTVTASFYNLSQLLHGVAYPGVKVTGSDYMNSPGYGGAFDGPVYDNVQFNEDGLALYNSVELDAVISSGYADLLLGTRSEDINIEGGAYVDAFSSHAPEELVPGIVFDSINISVYTKNSAESEVWGYRIFYDMLRNPTYYRISAGHATILTQDLLLADTEMHVADASSLPEPGNATANPGVVFINGERITYYEKDDVANTLGRLRRGTAGTGAPALHASTTVVSDAGRDQGLEIIDPLIQLRETALEYADIDNPGNFLPYAAESNYPLYNLHLVTPGYVDGTGLEGSTTLLASFIKDKPSAYIGNNILTVEAAVNIYDIALSTEDGQIIIIEA